LRDKDLAEMACLFNENIKTSSVPSEWLHSYLSPLHKPGKDHIRLNGFRIFTLQNTFGKVSEKIIARKLQNDLDRRNILLKELGSYLLEGTRGLMPLHLLLMFMKDSKKSRKQLR
jgi:hypothetical protein